MGGCSERVPWTIQYPKCWEMMQVQRGDRSLLGSSPPNESLDREDQGAWQTNPGMDASVAQRRFHLIGMTARLHLLI